MVSPITVRDDAELKASLERNFHCPCHNKTVTYILPAGHTVKVSSQLTVKSSVIESFIDKSIFHWQQGPGNDPVVGSIKREVKGEEATSVLLLHEFNSKNAKGPYDKKVDAVLRDFQEVYNKHWKNSFPLTHTDGDEEIMEIIVLSIVPQSKKPSFLKENESFTNSPSSEGTEVY